MLNLNLACRENRIIERHSLIRMLVCLVLIPLSLSGMSGPVGNPLVQAQECPLIVSVRGTRIAQQEVIGRYGADGEMCDFRVYFEAKVARVNKSILVGQHFEVGDTIRFYRDLIDFGVSEDSDLDAFLYEDQRVVFLRLDAAGAWFDYASYSQAEAARFSSMGLYRLVDIDGNERRWTTEELQALTYSPQYAGIRTPHDVVWPRTLEAAESTVLKSLKGGRELRRLRDAVEYGRDGFAWLDLRLIGLCGDCSSHANRDLCRVFGRVSPGEAKQLFCESLREKLHRERGPQEVLDWKTLEHLDSIPAGKHLNFNQQSLSECVAEVNQIIFEHDPSFGESFWDVHGEGVVNIGLRNLSVSQVMQFITQQVNGVNYLRPRDSEDERFSLDLYVW